MRRLFVPGYYSGFSNNRMSLDIAVVLAHLTGRVLVPYRFRLPRRLPVDAPLDCVVEPVLIPHLFEIPLPHSDEFLLKTWPSVPGALDCSWAPVFESVFCLSGIPPADDARFRRFRNGRRYVHSFSEAQNEAQDLYIRTEALGHYSYFFYLDDEQRSEVVALMKRLRPKRPYRAAANQIAKSLGRFNAIHVRRGDFVRNELSQSRITRAASISGQEIVANLATRMRRDDPLVICTDGSAQEEIFGPIQKHFRETIFLDDYLRQNAGIREMISLLPQNDESVFALLAQLVASKARVFAGTLFSTFTALIHRLRGFSKKESSFLYTHNDFRSPLVRFDRCEFLPVDDGPFTWNRIPYPVSPDAYSWFREWPESFDVRPPPFESAQARPGTLQLAVGDAALHGSAIRCIEVDAGQTMIGEWTDQRDFVTWDLVLATGGTYAVEIRYACPDESSGSRYAVGIEGSGELRAQVWNTGSWASVSPWFPLGRLHVPAGRSRLFVRAIEKDSLALMNLGRVRLVPTDRRASSDSSS